jgi:hypothetical protein
MRRGEVEREGTWNVESESESGGERRCPSSPSPSPSLPLSLSLSLSLSLFLSPQVRKLVEEQAERVMGAEDLIEMRHELAEMMKRGDEVGQEYSKVK